MPMVACPILKDRGGAIFVVAGIGNPRQMADVIVGLEGCGVYRHRRTEVVVVGLEACGMYRHGRTKGWEGGVAWHWRSHYACVRFTEAALETDGAGVGSLYMLMHSHFGECIVPHTGATRPCNTWQELRVAFLRGTASPLSAGTSECHDGVQQRRRGGHG